MNTFKIAIGPIFFIVLLLAIMFWATWPGSNSVNASTCEPGWIFPRLSSIIYQNNFWRAQLDDIKQKIVDVEKREAEYRRIESAAQFERQQKLDLYRKYMAPSAVQQEAERLRAQADQVESAEAFGFISDIHQKYLAQLRSCRAKIISVLQ